MMEVMFVLIAGAVIMLLTVLLGLHLKNKVEIAPEEVDIPDVSGGTQSYVAEITASENVSLRGELNSVNVSSTKGQISTKKINSDYLDILAMSAMSGSDIKISINEIVLAGYSAVSMNLTDTDGNLLYVSDAAASVSRIKSSDSEEKNLPDIELLSSIVAAAEDAGLSTSAIITNNFAGLRDSSEEDDQISYEAALFFDCTLIKELAKIGFDEIILMGYTFSADDKEQLTLEVSGVNDYIKALKAAAPDILIGIALPSNVYRNVKFTPYIEVLSQKADILAIDICSDIDPAADPEDIFNEVSDICSSIPGSFSLYNIRAVLSGDSLPVRTAQLDALLVNSVGNWQFISGPVS